MHRICMMKIIQFKRNKSKSLKNRKIAFVASRNQHSKSCQFSSNWYALCYSYQSAKKIIIDEIILTYLWGKKELEWLKQLQKIRVKYK